jgi:hypothetical protein
VIDDKISPVPKPLANTLRFGTVSQARFGAVIGIEELRMRRE